MKSYEKLLERAEEKISKELTVVKRFNVPKAEVLVQGNNTIIQNFSEIASYLNRDKKHLLKFLLKELAAPGEIKDNRAQILGRFTGEKIDDKIKLYVKEFVICSVCGKPDTKLIEEDGLTKIKCEACGSKRVVRKL
ncbi:MAG: translation initiation factor IF-2 subunit beta [Candidatus Aenigmarchaeota archaeon]|nr:translation initiation factor IF-2 subunit beta [Candidatus Aenigmarchaeota archaeon]